MNNDLNKTPYGILSGVANVTVVLQPLELIAAPSISNSQIFKDKESRDTWFFNKRNVFTEDCEIILSVEDVKMHSGNLNGVYRFLYQLEDDVPSLKLLTPLDLEQLTSSYFQKFLLEVSDFFLEE